MKDKERARKMGMVAGILLACAGITLMITFAVMQSDLSRLSYEVIGYHDKTAGTLGNETAELELKSDYTDTLILILMADLLSYAMLFIGLYLLLSGTGQFNAEYRRIPTKKDIIERLNRLETTLSGVMSVQRGLQQEKIKEVRHAQTAR